MRALLDTHAIIWWSENDPRIGAVARGVLSDPSSDLMVSAVSVYEMRLKHSLGKLPSADRLLQDPTAYFREQGYSILPLGLAHADLAGRLPLDHRDPFDRMLVAQAMIENIVLVSNEALFDQFGVQRLW